MPGFQKFWILLDWVITEMTPLKTFHAGCSSVSQSGGPLFTIRREDFIKLILHFREQGKTVIMASHHLHLGLELCNRAAILKSGKIVYLQDTARISKNDFKQIYSQQVGENALQLKVA
jgi:ABC-type proline/glycine betaine transport system ATPase subunit